MKIHLTELYPGNEIEFIRDGVKFVIINLSGKDKEIEIKIK